LKKWYFLDYKGVDTLKADAYFNLCVVDVFKARNFFEKLGFEIIEDYSDEKGFCLSINERAYLMMLDTEKFEVFAKNTVPDSFRHTEVIFSFDVGSKEKVDWIIETVIAHGGVEIGEAHEDDYMYYRSFRDLDGHHFEVMTMQKK
jgi:uncharacterized protein